MNKIRHNHWLFFIWTHDCPKCFLNQCLSQLDAEMFEFYIHNSELLTYWEKQYILEKYRGDE